MDILLELALSIVFEGAIEGVHAKKLPKWMRFVCILIVGTIFLLVIGIISTLALFFFQDRQPFLSLLFLLFDFAFILKTILKIKEFKERQHGNKQKNMHC